jgi:hypothetical protein
MWRPSGRLRNPESKSCCEFRVMQIITDIIEYLDERGLLSASDIAYLRQQGFIPTPEEPEHISGAQGAIDHRQAAIESVEDEFEAEVERRTLRRRSSGKGRAKPRKELTAAAMSAGILAVWQQWQNEMAALASFASLLAPASDLDAALHGIRNAKPAELDLAVASLLRSGKPPLAQLWTALAFDGYRTGLLPAGARGPAVRAYGAVISAARHKELGRYAHVLRQPGLARLFALVQAQHALLRAFGRCLNDQPQLFDRRLFSRRYDAVCYCSLTLAVSAMIAVGRPVPFRVHNPQRPWPDLAIQHKAWGCAAAMDSHAVAVLISYLFGTARASELFPPLAWRMLYCAAAWDANYVVYPTKHGALA